MVGSGIPPLPTIILNGPLQRITASEIRNIINRGVLSRIIFDYLILATLSSEITSAVHACGRVDRTKISLDRIREMMQDDTQIVESTR
jgi:hypothetical protein